MIKTANSTDLIYFYGLGPRFPLLEVFKFDKDLFYFGRMLERACVLWHYHLYKHCMLIFTFKTDKQTGKQASWKCWQKSKRGARAEIHFQATRGNPINTGSDTSLIYLIDFLTACLRPNRALENKIIGLLSPVPYIYWGFSVRQLCCSELTPRTPLLSFWDVVVSLKKYKYIIHNVKYKEFKSQLLTSLGQARPKPFAQVTGDGFLLEMKTIAHNPWWV